MDDLKSKFTSLLSKATNTANKLGSQKFSGQGHRLGTAEVQTKPAARAAQQSPTPACSSSNTSSERSRQDASNPSAPLAQAAGARGPMQAQQHSSTPPVSATVLKPATEFDGFTAVIGSGAALGANRGTPASPASAQPLQSSSPQPSPVLAAASGPGISRPIIPSSSSSPQPAHQHQEYVQVTAEQIEEMQHSLALIASQPAVAGSSMEVLSKLLSNLAAAPQEGKYRQIRLSNPRIQHSVVQVSGALEFLAAVGFQIHHDDAQELAASADSVTDSQAGVAVFLEDAQLGLVHEGMKQLQQALPAAQIAQQQHSKLESTDANTAASDLAASDSSRGTRSPVHPTASAIAGGKTAATSSTASISPPAVSISRDTLVLLPAAPDTTVPDWFFERTGAEVKADYMAMLRARQTGEVFASKTWKNAQLGKRAGPKLTVATVRTRFPEGVCLQGRFHVSEPASAVFEWVTGALRDPAITYELIKPDRKPLSAAGSVGDADLAPAVLLNFRPLGGQQGLYTGGTQSQSFLHDALLKQAQAD